MTLIAQISDLHLRRAGQLVEGRIDTAAFLEACIKRINQLPDRAKLVVASGDLPGEFGREGQVTALVSGDHLIVDRH